MTTLNKSFARLLLVTLLITLGLTVGIFADPPQGRGRAKGREHRAERFDRYEDGRDDCRGCGYERKRGRGIDKKDEKFINGHDARDGRWDGRGPKPKSRRLPPRRYFR